MVQQRWDFGARKYDDEFEKWWDACPKKVGKPRAATLFKQFQTKEAQRFAELLAFTRTYASGVRSMGIEDKFILHPATILSQRRWEDPKPKEKETDPAQQEWNALVAHVKAKGRYFDGALPVSEKGLAALKRVGGYNKICESSPWFVENRLKKEFLCAYSVL